MRRVGEWKLLVLSPILVFLGLLAIGRIESWAGIAVFAPTGYFTAAVRPAIENVINRQTPGAVRATILSVDSLLFRLMMTLLEPGVGLVADAHGLPAAFTGMALLSGGLMLILMLSWGRVRSRFEPSPTH